MKNIKKAFTLVELIVVVTILSILATVGFMSYSGYTVGARDTARQSDLATLNNSIKTLSQKDFNLLFLVDTGTINRTGSGGFYFGGKNLTNSVDYRVGGINFTYLTDISAPILDPTKKTSYVLGVYKNDYELAASMEETNTSYLLSSYNKRTASGTIAMLTGTVDTINKTISLLNIEDAVRFKIGDYIGTGSTNSKEILDIVGEKFYLSDVGGISSIDKIRILKDDTGLIGNSSIGAGTGVNCSDLSNLKQNICPIIENISNLIPYSLK